MNNKTSLIIEGGAMRGIFTAGVLDTFIKNDFYPFDLCYGVSAGAPNVALYLAGLYNYSYKIFTHYMINQGFKSWRRFLRGGNLLDIDWLWDEQMKANNLKLKEIFLKNSKLIVVTANAINGEVVYIEPNENNIIQALKAATSVPIVHRNMPKINGVYLMDGGVGDPLPVQDAYNRGARKILVVRTRKYDYKVSDKMDRAMSTIYLRNNPQLRKAISQKAYKYRRAIKYLRNPPVDAEVIEINPPISFQTERLTRDLLILNKDYELGLEMGKQALKQWNK
ncbi:patatin family protein [Clostridium sp. 'deep sea']|uniref:patatin-like phospholipase family protein n=1 Tax=Clostridium sp. 'deep sea' TaxID=2779445 RepID=UPI001896999F|nr:patatin family protein [Clostridium sp. 'deep sea']QOR34177.1 patatin family protein [Clostridium sp. 'deep sea']